VQGIEANFVCVKVVAEVLGAQVTVEALRLWEAKRKIEEGVRAIKATVGMELGVETERKE